MDPPPAPSGPCLLLRTLSAGFLSEDPAPLPTPLLPQWREAAAAAAEERWALERVAAAEGSGRASPKKLVFALRGQADLALLMPAFDGTTVGVPSELPAGLPSELPCCLGLATARAFTA